MCGIAGFHVKDPKVIKTHKGVELLVDELLKNIENRGKHATGFVSVGFDGKVVIDKEAKEASEFIKDRERIPEGVRTVLLHTRYATQGPKENHENNHPVIYGTCFAIHNGHINNDTELFAEYDLKRHAEVDSEAIAAAAHYNGIGEIADIKSTLEALEGGFATAIINPITNPGKLILAKGTNSPLYVVDTDKFLVWASTKSAITDAWGKVLGTPPNDKKIEEIKEGNFIVIEDREVTRDTFTVKRRPFVSQWKPWSSKKTTKGGTPGNGGHARSLGFKNDKEQPLPGNAVAKSKNAIVEYIRAGGTARDFDSHQAGMFGDEDFADVDNEDRRWHPCYGCNRLILEQDMKKTLNWGTICVDCETATVREIANAAADMQDSEFEEYDVCAGTTIPRIQPADRDALEIWADHEMALHRDTLSQLSKDCGSFYSPEVIEFLVFLTTPEYRDTVGKTVNHLISELRDAYNETFDSILLESQEIYAETGEPWPVRPALEAGEPVDDTGRFCYDHNRTIIFPDEGCEDCIREAEGDSCNSPLLDAYEEESEVIEGEVIADAPIAECLESKCNSKRALNSFYCEKHRPSRKQDYTRSSSRSDRVTNSSEENEQNARGIAEFGDGDIITLPKCPECHTFVLRDGAKCAVCERSPKENESVDGKANKIREICLDCGGATATIVVEVNKKRWAYCPTCFTSCGKLIHNEDKTVTLCDHDTRHTLKDGIRVCHTHVRSQAGAMSDTMLKKRGMKITEVTK